MRRILVICTTFYPDPQVAAIRMTQWARHLPEHGWKVHVLCRHYGYSCSAEKLARSVHPDVTLEYLDKNDFAPGMLGYGGRLLKWLRKTMQQLLRFSCLATLIVPDPSIRFWRQQRQNILRRVNEIQPDVILTSSPPHANHDIGLWLAAQTGIPWVADFRDPYLVDSRFKPQGLGHLLWGKHRRFKKAIYDRAWLITHAIPVQGRWARQSQREARGRMLTLTNAFPSSLPQWSAAMSERTGLQTVLLAGTIPESEQLILVQAMAQVVLRGGDVQLKMIGRLPARADFLRDMLRERLQLPGYLDHATTLLEMQKADVLVSFLDDFRSRTLVLSLKLFEYLASGKPMICINPSRPDRHLLHGRSGVEILVKPSLDEIVGALSRALTGVLKRDFAEVEQFRAEYNWLRRVEQLASALDKLVAFPPKLTFVREGAPVASIVIPTRNRCELLAKCIRSALAQSVSVEVIVMDDGSTDGTVEMVRREFPMIRVYTLGDRKGPCFQRNRGIEMAATEFVFPIDDDSVFSTPYVVEQTLHEFDHPRVAAVAIPFLNPRLSWNETQRDPLPEGCHVIHAFVGASHALRRSVFLAVGGYREHFFYMGEEGDLCLRMLASGYVTRLGRSDPVYHMESPRRNLALADRCGRRNDIYFAWQNVPAPYMPLHLLATTLNGVKAGVKTRHFWRMTMGSLEGYRECLAGRVVRQPVRPEIYRLHRLLKKGGRISLLEVEKHLPPLSETSGTLVPLLENTASSASHVC